MAEIYQAGVIFTISKIASNITSFLPLPDYKENKARELVNSRAEEES